VRGGAVLDGTEIGALIVSKRSQLLKVGDVILNFQYRPVSCRDGVLGVEAALYSILTYITAARTLDFVIHGIDAFTAMTSFQIVSYRDSRADHRRAGRRALRFTPEGEEDRGGARILYCVVTRLEVGK
jgi:uncharacterized membrane-anchored protein YitT (DUF2179 family)